MRLMLTLAATVLLAGCGGSSAVPADTAVVAGPSVRPAPAGDLPQARLSALLLQPADLPDLAQRRVYASPALTTELTPQLALCRPAAATAAHEVANVILSSAKLGMAKVFEVVMAYPDAAAATVAQAASTATAYACPSYQAQGVTYEVHDLAPVPVGPGTTAVQYRLATAGLTDGDVRTFAQQGRFTVFVTASGGTHRGRAMLDYQSEIMRKALLRLTV